MKKSSKEWDILLFCAEQISVNRAGKPLTDLIDSQVDWSLVLQLAGRHGLTGFLYSCLAPHGKGTVPANILDQFKAAYLQISARNIYLSACLLKILTLFKQNHIPAIPFKGPVQSELLYHDVGTRVFSDLDILVKPENAVQARDLLIDQGYRTTVVIPESQLGDYLKNENFFQLAHTSRNIHIDLHWEITGRYNLEPVYYPDENALIVCKLLDQEIRTLNYEDMLIHLCIHGTSHCWDKLELICSVTRMATGGFIDDWKYVLDKAKALRCKRMVLSGLLLAQNCFAIELDPVIRSAIDKDPSLSKLSDYIFEKIQNQTVGFSESLNWRFSHIHILIRDSYYDRLRYLFYLFTVPTIKEWSEYPLPSRFTALYRILRPARLLVTFLFTLFTTIFGNSYLSAIFNRFQEMIKKKN